MKNRFSASGGRLYQNGKNERGKKRLEAVNVYVESKRTRDTSSKA